MSLRSHFTLEGKPKIGYTKQEAERLAYDKGMHCYECPMCSKYHLAKRQGRNPSQQKRRMIY